MKTLTWSIALAALAYGTTICAAEKPASGKTTEENKGVLVFSTDGPEGEHYWIGIDANPLSAEQRKELHVDDDQGLLIAEVNPDSPAAKAGLEAHDILLKAGKKPLKQIADLSGAIQESKDQTLRLELKRDGKLQAIAVTPTKRAPGGLSFRLENPEIHLTFAGEAPSDKSKADGALPTALHSVLARAGDSERRASEDEKARERIKALLATRHELQQRVKDLNEKLRSLSNPNNPDGAAAENIRSEIRAAEQAIEAINQQTVMIELSRGNPDREKLTRQLRTLRQCAADLAEVGRTEEASHLRSDAQNIEQQLQAVGPAIGHTEPEQLRLLHFKTAIQLLEQNGLREQADLLREPAEVLADASQRMKRENERTRQQADAAAREEQQRRESSAGRFAPHPPDPAIDGLRGQVEEMRRELRELKEAVGRMSQRKD